MQLVGPQAISTDCHEQRCSVIILSDCGRYPDRIAWACCLPRLSLGAPNADGRPKAALMTPVHAPLEPIR